MSNDNITLDFYNTNASQFYTDTINVSFSNVQNNFVKFLPDKALILDFGCGSGRDSMAFISKGYRVDAIDGSVEMCKLAEKLIDQNVPCIRFQDFRASNKYDGIWACASILHLKIDELYEVLMNLKEALKVNGYLYTSFKYGDFNGIRNGRHFTDMTEDTFKKFIVGIDGLEIVEMKVGTDSRPGREEERWINIILRKLMTA